MTRAHLRQVQPVLPTKDVPAAIEYYVTRLGFALAFQDSSDHPGYAGVRRDGVALHLQWHDPAEWSAVERPSLRFLLESPEAVRSLFEEYQPQGVFHEHTTLRTTDWGTCEFAFFDADRNGLTFYADLPRP